MEIRNLGDMTGYEPLGVNDGVLFTGYRRTVVELDLIANGPLELWAEIEDSQGQVTDLCLGQVREPLKLKATVPGEKVVVSCRWDGQGEPPSVFVRVRERAQLMKAPEGETFTRLQTARPVDPNLALMSRIVRDQEQRLKDMDRKFATMTNPPRPKADLHVQVPREPLEPKVEDPAPAQPNAEAGE